MEQEISKQIEILEIKFIMICKKSAIVHKFLLPAKLWLHRVDIHRLQDVQLVGASTLGQDLEIRIFIYFCTARIF